MKNRNTTYESLKAFIMCVLAQDEETYCKYYELGTHDDGGSCSWFYVQKRYVKKERTAAQKEYARNYYREYYRRQKNEQRGNDLGNSIY